MSDAITERIRQAMTMRAVGFNEFDRKLGYSEGYTSRTLSKGRRPRADTVRRLAQILDVSAEWLITGKGALTFYPADHETPPKERYPNLAVALAYHGARWSDATIAAARALDLAEDPPAQHWADRLDRLEAAIRGVGEDVEKKAGKKAKR